MQRRRGLLRLVRGLTTVVCASLLLAGCAPAPRQDVRFAAFGDSITAATNGGGVPTHWTWVATAASGDVRDVGGYRHSGDTSADILAKARAVPTAEVAVVMAGTNDITVSGRPDVQTLTNIAGIFGKAGAPHRVLSAVPPRNDALAPQAARLNVEFRILARRSGWTWVDPWADLRTPDDRWRPGASVDGIHPTPASGHAAGLVLRAAIVKAARGG